MEVKELNSWEEFEKQIDDTFANLEKPRKQKELLCTSEPLFRGQSNAKWFLETTLDRIQKKVSCSKYYRIMQIIRPTIETCALRRWSLPSKYKEPEQRFWVSPRGYKFMIYLRHHKFPSPLLDWTRSPYIAAFFAFNEMPKAIKEAAIFTYTETAGYGKEGCGEDAMISTSGSTVAADKRHYLQQCDYTTCTKKEDETVYWSHNDVFAENNEEQDLLIKYILPVSERKKVLKKLDLMNINAYSLFDTEESLMDTLSTREFFIKGL